MKITDGWDKKSKVEMCKNCDKNKAKRPEDWGQKVESGCGQAGRKWFRSLECAERSRRETYVLLRRIWGFNVHFDLTANVIA